MRLWEFSGGNPITGEGKRGMKIGISEEPEKSLKEKKATRRSMAVMKQILQSRNLLLVVLIPLLLLPLPLIYPSSVSIFSFSFYQSLWVQQVVLLIKCAACKKERQRCQEAQILEKSKTHIWRTVRVTEKSSLRSRATLWCHKKRGRARWS